MIPKEMIPEVGMEFLSEIAAYEFYGRYAEKVGFTIRRSKGHKDRDGEIIDRVFCCSCQGKREKDKRDVAVRVHRPETRCGCLAEMKVNSRFNSKFRVIKFLAEHNHPLETPRKPYSSKSKKKSTISQAYSVEKVEHLESIPMARLESTARQAVGLEAFASTCKNSLHTKRKLEVKYGDMGYVLEYLQCMKLEDPYFFYAIQVDKADLITNIFWADSRMMVDYGHFGDVVCFDRTCRRSDEGRPLALFVGVNHHKQIIIFGVAVLYDDTPATFKWLFDSFIKAMSGRKPMTLFTDQDAVIAEAVALHWPETYHRLGIWHIYQSATESLGDVFEQFSNFAVDFSNCLYDHEEEEDFINAWNLMLEKYNLQENGWLRGLYNQKEKWALVYRQQTFCADIYTAQRNETIYNEIKKNISYKHELLHFFNYFQGLVEDRRYEELKSDFKARQSTPALAFPVEILRHAASVYTPELFKIFQHELGQTWNCDMHDYGEIGTVIEYKVTPYGKHWDHIVTYDSSDGTVMCSCKKFEFVGILCSHALKVLASRNVRRVPARYILKRWAKNAKDVSIRDSTEFTKPVNLKAESKRRYKVLSHLFMQLAARAAETEEAYGIAVGRHGMILEEVEASFIGKAAQEPSVGPSHGFFDMSQRSAPTVYQQPYPSIHNSSLDQRGFSSVSHSTLAQPPLSRHREFVSSSSR